mmetsp:Transcript_48785/g.105888  ORF Transcript_48785/g.105888 Transcript_48785/m.105888 type:complete len:208 (-) Transcript_48785:88-711(-)
MITACILLRGLAPPTLLCRACWPTSESILTPTTHSSQTPSSFQFSLSLIDACPTHHLTQLSSFFLRLNYYPPVSEADDASGAGRLIGHEDLSLFTLLPAPEVEGLQVWHRGLGSWVLVQVPKGSIIFNTGDYMQRITNDRYPSTTHRVGKPRNGSHLKRSRVSFPVGPFIESDQMLEVFPELGEAKYPPIKAHDFHQALIAKFNSEK